MNPCQWRKPVRPVVPSLARRVAALKDAARRLRRWPREAARPSLTAATRLARGSSGRNEKTALQPNQKTRLPLAVGRTTHALQTADIFTRQRHASERELRPTATYRKVTGGFRSNWGTDLFAAVRPAIATAPRRGHDADQAIRDVLDGEAAIQPG
jgi:hypothetical protein